MRCTPRAEDLRMLLSSWHQWQDTMQGVCSRKVHASRQQVAVRRVCCWAVHIATPVELVRGVPCWVTVPLFQC